MLCRQSFNARFYDAARHLYDQGSQTAQAMPLVVGLAPDEERVAVLQALVADIKAHGNHVTAGDVGFHYVVDALMDGGRSDVLYDMLERTDSPSYGYQLALGATSLTEAWDANPDSSQDHFMLGHAEEWFYRGLGGIRVDFSAKPPRQLIIRPEIVGKVSWVRTSYVSEWGLVESNWRRGPQDTEYSLVIPGNATAILQLQTAAPQSVKVERTGSAQAAGMTKTVTGAHRVEIQLPSGSYRIVAANRAEQP